MISHLSDSSARSIEFEIEDDVKFIQFVEKYHESTEASIEVLLQKDGNYFIRSYIYSMPFAHQDIRDRKYWTEK